MSVKNDTTTDETRNELDRKCAVLIKKYVTQIAQDGASEDLGTGDMLGVIVCVLASFCDALDIDREQAVSMLQHAPNLVTALNDVEIN